MSASGLAILISGSGTIMEAMSEAGVPIDLVLADRDCAGVEKARRLGLQAEVLPRTDFNAETFDYAAYSDAAAGKLRQHAIKKVVLAGWMTILAGSIFDETAYGGRILNIHPALLPLFPGAHGVRGALAAGVAETGSTIHVATEHLDSGPIVAQRTVPVLPGDTEARLHERIKVMEREFYPETVKRWLAGELTVEGLVG